MGAFNTNDILELRKKTGCGAQECKKALEYSFEKVGDKSLAIAYLKAKGLAVWMSCSFDERVLKFKKYELQGFIPHR